MVSAGVGPAGATHGMTLEEDRVEVWVVRAVDLAARGDVKEDEDSAGSGRL